MEYTKNRVFVLKICFKLLKNLTNQLKIMTKICLRVHSELIRLFCVSLYVFSVYVFVFY
jgi:hypothetical protein